MGFFDERRAEESEMTTLFHHAKRTPWQKMNRIQKGGVIAGFIFACIGFDKSKVGFLADLVAMTCLYLGCVIGYLVRFRHALHFWWCCLAAILANAALLPAHGWLIRYVHRQPHLRGHDYTILLFGPTIGEVLVTVFLAKQVAVWQRRHRVPRWGV